MKKSDNQEAEDHDFVVGYKKPPQQTRFQPGRSGNPRGRPKQNRTVTEIVSRQLRRKVTVNDGHQTRKVPVVDAIVMTHISKAAKGDHKSTKFVFEALEVANADANNNLPELLNQFRAIHEARSDQDHHLPATRGGNEKQNG
jgi:hypothetical protein